MQTINWAEAFQTARLVRDVVVLHQTTGVPRELQRLDALGGMSLFEVFVGIYVAHADREIVANLFVDAVRASESPDLLISLVAEMRGCAMTDAASVGFLIPSAGATH
jgi:O-succinylbenzoate synthase